MLLVGFACKHTHPARRGKGCVQVRHQQFQKGRNGRLEFGRSLYTCPPPCPKPDLGTSVPLLLPKRGTKPETRALLPPQSPTAPGNPLYSILGIPNSTFSSEDHPPCLLALPHLDTYTTTVSTLEEQNTVQYCARMPVRNKTALGSPSCKCQQLQTKSPQSSDIDTIIWRGIQFVHP